MVSAELTDTSTRRSVAELATTYLLHPAIHDVLFEGRSDARRFQGYIDERIGRGRVRCYAVSDRVHIPRTQVEEAGEVNNNRGRVIATLRAIPPGDPGSGSLHGVVDLDFDELLPHSAYPERLFTTDFPAVENYSLRARPLRKYLLQVDRGDIDENELLRTLTPAWKVLFTYRAALLEQDENRSLPGDIASSLLLDPPRFDVADLIRRTSPTPDARAATWLTDRQALLHSQAPPDGLSTVRGHDIAPVLIRALKLKNEHATVASAETALSLSVEFIDLDGETLFQLLIRSLEDALRPTPEAQKRTE